MFEQIFSGEVLMRVTIASLAVVTILFVIAVPAFSHHSDVAYERTGIELKNATIVKVAWINPHGIVSCDVKDDAGKVTRWTLEMGSPSAMSRVGWDRNSLSPGDLVKIDVNPAKNGTKFGRLLRVTRADGKMLRYIEPGSRGEPPQQ
jgi:Family of unknown function (DUF6152)